MIGILVELLLSYFLLKYLVRENLNALGFQLNRRHIQHFLIGLSWPVIYYCLYEFGLAALVHNPYRINPDYNLKQFFAGLTFLLRTVGYEELIFRGALLYLLIRNLGPSKAIFISAIAFGIYHWFSWQAFGNPVQMLIVFLTTGSAGLLFAYGFQRTGSLYLPASLHLGADLATMLLFSKSGTFGPQLLIKSFTQDPYAPNAFISVPVLLIHFTAFQLLTWLMIRKFSAHFAINRKF